MLHSAKCLELHSFVKPGQINKASRHCTQLAMVFYRTNLMKSIYSIQFCANKTFGMCYTGMHLQKFILNSTGVLLQFMSLEDSKDLSGITSII